MLKARQLRVFSLYEAAEPWADGVGVGVNSASVAWRLQAR